MATMRKKNGRLGFTLIELLVALSVIGVAVSLYVSLYTSSLEIGENAQNRTVAMGLAESQLQQILAQPDAYLWQVPSEPSLEPFDVKLSEDDPKAGNAFPPPASMPADKRAFNRQDNIYAKFRWHAFAQLPALDSTHVQLTLTVNWREGARERAVALTSLVPRSQVEALSQ